MECYFCGKKSIIQCNICEETLLCEICKFYHLSYHDDKKEEEIFGPVTLKFSEIKLKLLNESIEKYLRTILRQKKVILKEALINNCKDEIIVKNAMDELENMNEEYTRFLSKSTFNIEDFIKAEKILRESLEFVFPDFKTGILTKNEKICKTQIFKQNKATIQSDYGILLEGHNDPILCAVISYDCHFLITGSQSPSNMLQTNISVRAWNLYNLKQFAEFQGHSQNVVSVAITKDNQYIISGSIDNTVRLWNLYEKRLENIFKGHTGSISQVAVTSDNQYIISASNDRTISVWNLFYLNNHTVFKGHTDHVSALKITNDDLYVISGSSDMTIRIWDIKNKCQVKVVTTNRVVVLDLLIDNDICIFRGWSQHLYVWNMHESDVIEIFEGHTANVGSFAISCDKQIIVSGSSDKSIIVWNLATKEQIAVLKGHSNRVTTVAIANNNSFIVSGSSDTTVRMWDLGGCEIAVLKGHKDEIIKVFIIFDNAYAISISYDKTIIMWNLLNKCQELKCSGHNSGLSCFAISSDNLLGVSGSGTINNCEKFSDNSVRVWDLIEKHEILIFNGHTSRVNCVAITNNKNFVVSGSGCNFNQNKDNSVRVWNILENREIAIFNGHTDSVNGVAISNDGKLVVSGSKDKSVRIWKVEGQELDAILEGHTDSVRCVEITKNQQFILSGSEDKSIRIWSICKRQQEAILEKHKTFVTSLRILYDDQYVVSNSDHETIIWNLNSRKVEINTDSYERFCGISSDETICLSDPKKKTIKVWNVKEKECIASFKDKSNVCFASLTLDCKFLVTKNLENFITIWNLDKKSIEISFKCLVKGINDSAVTSNANYVVFGYKGNHISVWKTNKKDSNDKNTTLISKSYKHRNYNQQVRYKNIQKLLLLREKSKINFSDNLQTKCFNYLTLRKKSNKAYIGCLNSLSSFDLKNAETKPKLFFNKITEDLYKSYPHFRHIIDFRRNKS
ncbi:hypothetical protein SteCoe_24675 [Stentor coeruleus]|uniref:C2H2-type domain-containing protein n=1 Tax=Stentor coeruleus TaxID=5963 RepID=A0A1R2BH20_9CILI|nr:hypothetical protein SteCoe_24675 [Stentor coeruleus]